MYCFAYLLYALFERIVNEPFEEQPEQQYEEEQLEAVEQEGKWIFPLCIFYLNPMQFISLRFTYEVQLHELDWDPLRMTSLDTLNLDNLGFNTCWVAC